MNQEIQTIVEDAMRGIDPNKCGNCIPAAISITKSLLAHGVKDFTVVEGFLNHSDPPSDHTWIEMNSGEKIDPTVLQFEGGDADAMRRFYSPRRKNLRENPLEYLAFFEQNEADRHEIEGKLAAADSRPFERLDI